VGDGVSGGRPPYPSTRIALKFQTGFALEGGGARGEGALIYIQFIYNMRCHDRKKER